MNIRQHIERALFGATAEEAVAMRLKLIDQRVKKALDRLADGLEQDLEQDSDNALEDPDQTADSQGA